MRAMRRMEMQHRSTIGDAARTRLRAAMLLVLGACRPEPQSATSAPEPTPAPVATAEPEPMPDPPAIPENAFAVVNGVPLPFTAFHEIYDLKVAKYHARGREVPASADRRYRKSISERLIYHEVLRQAAEQLGVAPDPAVIDERHAQAVRGIRDFAEHLVRRGETEHSLREMYVAEERERLILERRGDLTVTPEEIEARYQEAKDGSASAEARVRASHIFVPHETPDAEKHAKQLHARALQPGTDFAALARETSSGPSREHSGDLGIFSATFMEASFSKAAFALKVGQISKPVRTKYGWHIIKVTGTFAPGPLPREALEGDLREQLTQRKLHTGRRALKEELLASATILDAILPTLGPEPARRPLAATVPDEAPLGIAECDAVFRDWTACVTTHRPDMAKDSLLGAIAEGKRAIRESLASGVSTDEVRPICVALRSQLREQMTSSGCSWPGP